MKPIIDLSLCSVRGSGVSDGRLGVRAMDGGDAKPLVYSFFVLFMLTETLCEVPEPESEMSDESTDISFYAFISSF